MQSSWVEKVLDFAIVNEERAADLYRYLAQEAADAHMNEAFLRLASEEDEHKAKLLDVKADVRQLASEEAIDTLGLAEQIDEPTLDLSGNMDYQQALALAMKAEQAAHELYRGLAEATTHVDCKSTLLALAAEEAQHKLQLEIEYNNLTRNGKRGEG